MGIYVNKEYEAAFLKMVDDYNNDGGIKEVTRK